MNMNDVFPSKYIKAADLGGQVSIKTMNFVQMEEMGDGEQKPVLYFQNEQKGLVLNKTNTQRIVTLYGQESGGWAGKELELYPDLAEFRGTTTECVRVRRPTGVGQQNGQPQQQTPQGGYSEVNPPPADTFPGDL